jgi:hypothetical protein
MCFEKKNVVDGQKHLWNFAFPRKIKLIKSKEVINNTLTCLIHII